MKRLLIVLSLIVLSLTGYSAMSNANNTASPAGERTDITRLWKDYDAAVSADRPQRQMDILQQIKGIALKERLAWDYYRAGREYVQAGSRRNWKLRDSLQREFQDGILLYDEPVMTFYDGRNVTSGKFDFVSANKSRLEKGHNTDFYENDNNVSAVVFAPALLPLIENDYQYTLWSLALRNSWETAPDIEKSRDALTELLKGRYPQAELVEYCRISRERDEFRRKEHLEVYADKNKGKAVSLLARQDLLSMEFSTLTDKQAGQEAFKELRAKCDVFEKDLKDLSKKEKSITDCCTRVKDLIEELEEKTLDFSISNGVLEVRFKNLDGADFTISDSSAKKVLGFHLDNPSKSYYVYDELKYTLPEINDGKYMIEGRNGNVKQEQEYSKYTLSAAIKQDATGYALFLARSVSGEPVRNADIALQNDEGKTVAELRGFALDGFTYLPETFTSKISKKSWDNYLVCSFTDTDGIFRQSNRNSISPYTRIDRSGVNDTYASIYVDRTAFNPDETVHFKTVVYQGDRRTSLKTVESGKKYTVNLMDAEGNKVSSKTFTTNEFGAFAGEFVLERRERNGRYTLEVMDGKRYLAETALRVDDFVLPTFDLNFDPVKEIYFPGDEIVVAGAIKSYSGHSLAAADIHYTVSEGGKVVKEDVLRPEPDGKFRIGFKADSESNWAYYDIKVRVTDATGETLEWSTEREAQRHIPFDVALENKAEARNEMDIPHEWKPDEQYYVGIVSDDEFVLNVMTSRYGNGQDVSRKSLKIAYTLKYGGEVLAEGKAAPGDRLELNTAGHPSGLYVFEAKASDKDIYGNVIETSVYYDIIKVKDSDNALNVDAKNLFKIVKGDDIAIQIGSTDGPVWAIVDLYGAGNILLGSRMVHLTGVKGQAGSLETVKFDWLDSWSDTVMLHVIYFKNNRQYNYTRQYDRSAKRLELPLAFTRFLDKTSPGASYSFEIATKPGVECAATIFDKSTEKIMANNWHRVTMLPAEVPYVRYNCATGSNESRGIIMAYGASPVLKSASNARVRGIPALSDNMELEVEEESMMVMEDAAPMPEAMAAGAAMSDEEAVENVTVRENFANTIAFEPFLRSDAEGKIVFDFTNADKLSTYYVQLFAHNKDMDNAVQRQEMVVTIPVKVSVVEPQFLYTGDRYNVKASLSSSVVEAVSGRLRVEFFDGKDYKGEAALARYEKSVVLDGFGALSEEFPVAVPAIRDLGIKVSFIADNDAQGSDAVFVCVPVYPAEQTLTEAHSGILRSGDSMEALLARLKSEFVNISGDEADMRNLSLLEMIREAVPSKAEPASENVLDQSEALYIRLLASKLGSDILSDITTPTDDIIARIKACQNYNGGFGWFEGMESSPVITAVLLQRYASLRDRGLLDDSAYTSIISSAVSYLDKSYFGEKGRPIWCGGLSWEQYVTTRTRFASVEFDTKGLDKDNFKAFKKEMKEYLVPGKERGLNGYVLGKARRMRTLLDLSGSEAGRTLAKAWGVKLATGKRLTASLHRDLDSIMEYAVEHRSGGCYYPNAVMPFRGLLESEAYAHAFIADLLRDCCAAQPGYSGCARAAEIADGLRLWLMVQKETQKWEEDAAFVDAISTVLDGSENILETRIITLSKTFSKPFDKVKAAGNGMTIERKFFVEKAEAVDGTSAGTLYGSSSDAQSSDRSSERMQIIRIELKEGDEINVGDKIVAEYRIWNEENRSFIKVTAPRMASLRPVEQLSGRYGWMFKPLRVAGWYSVTPQGYRSVLTTGTEYWFDTYPEENTVITEEFFVTQSGIFQTPAVEIESLYAPHYRANGSGLNPVTSR